MDISQQSRLRFAGRFASLGIFAGALVSHAQPPERVQKVPTEDWPVVLLADVLKPLGGPTLVTLKFQDAPLEDVLKELSRRSNGFQLISLEAKKLVTVDIEQRPFWPAVRELALKYPITVKREDELPGRDLSLGNAQTPVWMMDGFFAVARNLSRSKSSFVRFDDAGTAPVTDSFTVAWQLFADPKLPLPTPQGVELEVAQDDSGKNLKQQRQLPWAINPFYPRMGNLNFNVTLLPPAPNAKRLARLQGTMRILHEQKTQVWEITDLESVRNLSKTLVLNGVTCKYTLESFALNEDGYKLKMHGEATPPTDAELKNLRPPRDFNAPFRIRGAQLIPPRVTLLDQKGRPFVNNGGSRGSRPNAFSADFMFSQARPMWPRLNVPNAPNAPNAAVRVEGDISVATELRLEFPSDIALIKIPFEFTDLPLPQFNN